MIKVVTSGAFVSNIFHAAGQPLGLSIMDPRTYQFHLEGYIYIIATLRLKILSIFSFSGHPRLLIHHMKFS